MSKHTPAPWIADSVNTQDDTVTAVWQDDGSSDYYHRMPQICECFWDTADSETFDARPLTLAEAEANARLISAAPDLLEALKNLADWLAYGLSKAEGAEPTAEDHATCERLAAAARAAVDKAEGRRS